MRLFCVDIDTNTAGCHAGPCGHCRPPLEKGLRYGRESTEATGRVRENVPTEVEEPVLRFVENRQLVLLSGMRTAKMPTCILLLTSLRSVDRRTLDGGSCRWYAGRTQLVHFRGAFCCLESEVEIRDANVSPLTVGLDFLLSGGLVRERRLLRPSSRDSHARRGRTHFKEYPARRRLCWRFVVSYTRRRTAMEA